MRVFTKRVLCNESPSQRSSNSDQYPNSAMDHTYTDNKKKIKYVIKMRRFLSLVPQARWRENGLECPILLYCIVCMMLTLSQKPRWPVLKPTDESGSFSPPNTDWQQQQQEQNQNGGGGDGVSFGADPSDNSNQGSV